jgi:FkbM family methyltransferase
VVDDTPQTTWSRSRSTAIVSRLAGLVPPRLLHTAVARVHHRPEPIMREIMNRCDPNGTGVDVGVWFGPWTYWMARRMTAVHAVEPNPRMVDFLRRAVASNVTVHAAAASDHAGRGTLHFPVVGLGSEGTANLSSHQGSEATADVELIRLDDLGLRDVRLIKFDVEGHETEAINGAAELLQSSAPVIVIELDYRAGDMAETMALLREMGYEGKVLIDDVWRPTTDFDLAAWQSAHHGHQAQQSYLDQVRRTQTYVNNVVWVHPRSTWSPWSA